MILNPLQYMRTEIAINKTFDELNTFFKAKDEKAFDYFNAHQIGIYGDLINLLKKLSPEQRKEWPIDHLVKTLISIIFNVRHDLLYRLIDKTQFEYTGLLRSRNVVANFLID